MKITNESEYCQNIARYKAINEEIINMRWELESIYDTIVEYQESDTYNQDRRWNPSCEMRSREFENLKSEFKSEKGVEK